MSAKQPKSAYAVGYIESGNVIFYERSSFPTIAAAQKFVAEDCDDDLNWIVFKVEPVLKTKPITRKREWVNVGKA